MQAFFVSPPSLDQTGPYHSLMHPGGRPAKRPRSPIGDRIAHARIQAGLSQIELARRLGVSQQVVAAWERKATTLRSSTLSKLTEVLAISSDHLLGTPNQPVKQAIPKGRLGEVFEAVAKLPRRQQEKVVEFVEGFVALQQKRNPTS